MNIKESHFSGYSKILKNIYGYLTCILPYAKCCVYNSEQDSFFSQGALLEVLRHF